MENSQAAEFVAELERKVQEIKEEFTKTVHGPSKGLYLYGRKDGR
jgi:hypothetical protein